jgi:dTDP-4-amino-4,6-dideoxygalactose transaminase
VIRVPFYDLHAVNHRFERESEESCARVLNSGWFLQGQETAAFETEFAIWNGAAHCVGVANGLDALRLVLSAWLSLGVLKAGDEVVVPANSFIASALAVTQAGLCVRFCDVEQETFNVSVRTLSRAITERTRVVMPVHLYGRLADMNGIREFCRERDIRILEDAAQAHGARSESGAAGTMGDAGAFSFYPSKNLGGIGDGGCVVTDDLALADRVRALGNYGSAAKYQHLYLGTNSRLDEIQAAFLREKLKWLDADNERRRQVALAYGVGIRNAGLVKPAAPSPPASHVWHLYVIRARERADLMRHLHDAGVEVMIHYPCAIHRQPAYAESMAASAVLQVCDELQHEVLSLPMSPVMTDEQVNRVIDAINAWRVPRAHRQ